MNRRNNLTAKEVEEIINSPNFNTSVQKMHEYIVENKFPEKFLREWIGYCSLGEIFIYQDVSKEFIREFVTRETMLHVLFGTKQAKDEKFYKEIEERFEKP